MNDEELNRNQVACFCLTNLLGCDAVIYASPAFQLYGLI